MCARRMNSPLRLSRVRSLRPQPISFGRNYREVLRCAPGTFGSLRSDLFLTLCMGRRIHQHPVKAAAEPHDGGPGGCEEDLVSTRDGRGGSGDATRRCDLPPRE